MAEQGKPKAEAKAKDALEKGIEKLKLGKDAPGWVCREVLCLHAAPAWGEITAAVHKEIHRAKGMERIGDQNLIAGIAIAAGASLLRRMMGQ